MKYKCEIGKGKDMHFSCDLSADLSAEKTVMKYLKNRKNIIKTGKRIVKRIWLYYIGGEKHEIF